ncbi:MAG: hypothetical protein FJ265_10765 [Planctomycetes bacterium]|nr:hypothetical protein [Planctomycetota bacterium]
MNHATILLGLFLCPGPLLSAQDFAWRLPLRGAAEYRRDCQTAAGPTVRTAADARAVEPNGKVPESYLPRLSPAPFLCQGELDPAQRAIADPIRDPRDVLRALAFDLAGRSARTKFPRVLPFGDLTVTGSWTTPGPDGAQVLRATVAAARPTVVAGERQGTADRLRRFCLLDAGGTLELRRTLDPAAGLVRSFAARLDLVVEDGDRRFRRFRLDDDWQFVALRDNQDADFRKRVAQAIRLGTGFVREAIDERKSFLVDDGKENRSYGGGRLALALLTLLHGGVRADDPVVARGFGELRRRKLVDTYSLAAALMALAARAAPAGEADRIRNGELAAVAVRTLEAADRTAAAKWVAQLLRNVDPRTDPGKLLRFNYTAGPRTDTSLQQYGLLGLWSGHLCGAEVPGAAFAAAARQLLEVQGAAEGRIGLRLLSYSQQREVAGTGVEPRVPERRAAARGFAYEAADEPPFGSMTSAGTSGLLLARAGMLATGCSDRALEQRIDDAVLDGFGWLAREFTVRANPGFAERADHHWYYWLHGLERSCELRGIAWLQDRDWYYEGALQLLAQQQPNGSFRAEQPSSLLIESTCFALLFLSRSTPAVPITGG